MHKMSDFCNGRQTLSIAESRVKMQASAREVFTTRLRVLNDAPQYIRKH